MCGASGSWPRPFAVGVLALTDSQDAGRRSAARLELALDAYKCGYFLVDTVETTPAGTGYLAAELLVARSGANAVVAGGPVDSDWLYAIADRHRLEVRHAERQGPCGS